MQQNCCYEMIAARDNVSLEWVTIPFCKFWLQVGTKYGYLIMSLSFQCGCSCQREFFFSTNTCDYVLTKCMQVKTLENKELLILTLPTFEHNSKTIEGFFTLKQNVHKFTDEYILRVLSQTLDENETVEHLFVHLQKKIAFQSFQTLMVKQRRNIMRLSRMHALHVLAKNDVNEVCIRKHIIKLAKMW